MPVTLAVPLSSDQAEALAQLSKRFSYGDAQRFSDAHNNTHEADHMIDALKVIRAQLVKAGYAPR